MPWYDLVTDKTAAGNTDDIQACLCSIIGKGVSVMYEVVLPIFCVGILILIRVLATQDHAVGRICRMYWNFSFSLAAVIPFCGWMTCMVIKDREEE